MTDGTRIQKHLITAFLFISGACALVYELVWSKYLGNVLGNSGQAHAVVLATFMGGLALGAYLFGRTADRVKVPLRIYALLELGIGGYALVFHSVLMLLQRVYLAIAPAMPESTRIIAKLFLAGAALLPPTILMGGTLPPLLRHFTSQLSGLRRELARLYAVNSLGAATGAFLAGVQLVPELGLANATRLAAALNIFIALSALALARRPSSPAANEEEDIDEPEYPLGAVRIALWGSALSGFSAMVMQVAWIRLLALVLGGSTYAFTLILTAFITGIGLGSLWLARRRRGDTLKLFGALQVGIAVAVCIALPLYVRMPYWLWEISHLLNHTKDSWGLYQTLAFFLCCIVLLVPTALMGASFPAVARVATAKVSEMGRRLGGVYLWNTFGTVLGSLLCGLLFMPQVRMEGAFAIAVAINILAGGLAFRAIGARGRGLWPIGAATAAALVFFVGSAGWTTTIADASAYRETGAPPETFESFRRQRELNFTNLFYRDDTFGTVVVGKTKTVTYMRINGKVEASDDGDMGAQILVGQLGPLLHSRQVKRALLVGLGSGVTLGSLLSHPGVEHVDVVEISPAVVEGAVLFNHVNHRALEDPRVKVHIDDARTFMLLQGKKYDLIISQPSNPWIAGVAGLFTREFFQLAKAHLEADGLLVQWMHLYEISPELVKLVIRTMRETFRFGTSWLGVFDVLMVASAEELTPDPEKLAARLAVPTVRDDLMRVHAESLAALLALQVHSNDGQLLFAGEGEINTEDKNLLEYEAPKAFYLRLSVSAIRDERRASDGGKNLAIAKWMEKRPLTAEDAKAIYTLLWNYGGDDSAVVRAAAERWFELAPEDPPARTAAGYCALAQKDVTRAESIFGPPRFDSRDPELVTAWTTIAAWHVHSRHATFNAVTPPDLREMIRETLKLKPDYKPLQEAAQRYCRDVEVDTCLSASQ